MEFRTLVERSQDDIQIHLHDVMMLFGSCFSENIGSMLSANKFLCDVNPFGVLYNPASISKALLRLCDPKPYNSDDLFYANGLWNSWMHHSSFSSADASAAFSGAVWPARGCACTAGALSGETGSRLMTIMTAERR